VPAAEHNHERSLVQVRSNRLAQVLLVEFQIPRDFQIAQIPGSAQQIFELLGAGIRGQAIERGANRLGSTSGPNPATVTANPFIRREAKQHRPRWLVWAQPSSQQAAEARIVRCGVGDWGRGGNDAGHGAFQRSIPAITVMTQALGRK
jgi:hypothetical protein